MNDHARMCCPFCATVSQLRDDGSFLRVNCGFHGNAVARVMLNEGVSLAEAMARFCGDRDGNEL